MKRLTGREEDVFFLIKERPTISREIIADKLDISESAVGTHIHNLTNKGFLLGKGYIIASKEKMVVVGGSNIDLKGYSQDYLKHTSNPGEIRESFGGVGRNIAENLGLLGQEVIFLTAVADDHFGKKIVGKMESSEVDMNHIKRVDQAKTGLYLAHLDQKGELIGAISDMEILEHIDHSYLKEKRRIIEEASLLIFDTNLSEEVISYLIQITSDQVEIMVEPVSVDKSHKLRLYLESIDYITPNISEAQVLLDLDSMAEQNLTTQLEKLRKRYRKKEGLPVMIISCGKRGVFLLNEEDDIFIEAEEIEKADIVETTGAGDALAAGIADGLARGEDIVDAVEFGIKAASLTIKSELTVNPDLGKIIDKEE